mmetsp:Transcript_51858/g.123389  ORF Transcript_51858/g.123389 Transcript_51858/m.123389 type:complete len:105 (-) Transcript_51858:2917-3231(-)
MLESELAVEALLQMLSQLLQHRLPPSVVTQLVAARKVEQAAKMQRGWVSSVVASLVQLEWQATLVLRWSTLVLLWSAYRVEQALEALQREVSLVSAVASGADAA